MATFDKRSKDRGPVFVGDSSRSVMGSINVGDTVTLHIDEIPVVVTVTQRTEATYKGTVTGFETFLGTEHKGIREGSPVEFSFEDVFSCGKTT